MTMNPRLHRHWTSRLGLGLGVACAAVLASLAGCGKNPIAPGPLPPLSAVVITPASDTVQVGQTKVFDAVAYDTLGAPVTNASIAWTSLDPTIFSVSSFGVVRGLTDGVGRLVASAGGLSDTAVVWVYRQAGWFSQASRTTANLNGVFFQADGRHGWAVGNSGVIVATSDGGDVWSQQVSYTSFNLNAVWFTGPDSGWAVGNIGSVRHTTDGGRNWAIVVVPSSENLMDVVFTSRDTGWTVGSGGVILRTTDAGGHWQKSYPTTLNLRGVAFDGSGDGWAVGDAGVIEGTHDRGLSWFVVQPALTSQQLRGVWRRGEEMAWAVGGAGVTPRTQRVAPDTTSWELRNAGISFELEDACFPEDLIGYAVGYNGAGATLRTDDGGVTWQAQASSTQFRLNDVFFVDAMRGWAVGNGGTILHTSRGGLP
jgi:photosystem II stability/assembly factor-like uncharacterized protein